ncbi:AbiEi antitoxin N-terminal domain-containing protein [Bradyrhizobium barranii]|uniref:AbiEi antitoxin N-terminal domain-containing protein n=1 Tax=Bradyrhizobium barranii TaxID=2992140 RepID=UPI002AB0FA14|nr:AbiEi antitoxin N-terminal domain-containing protein [Bradyrhizobium barranii]
MSGKLNWLEKYLPEGLMVDAAWLEKHGYSTGLRSQYVAAGWLDQPTRGVYRRPRGELSWQQAIISLQTILNASPVIVGGRTALDLQGFAHYLPRKQKRSTSMDRSPSPIG